MEKEKMFFTISLLMLICITSLRAQQSDQKFTAGVDLYSSYVFRGTRFGTGSAVQPSVKFISGGLTAGVWGSFDTEGYAEADPYISFTFPFGLSLGFTDYYYPGMELFDVSEETGSHAFEINTGFTKGGFSISGNYIINESGGAASSGGDLYFQAGYSITNVNIFAGAGNGWHTCDGEFNICNIGLSATKQITLSEKFSFPLIGMVIVNPEREQLFVVAGFSF